MALALTGAVGLTYVVAVLALDAAFAYKALMLWRGYTPRRTHDLFRFSIVYLGLVFAALLADVAVRSTTGTGTLV